MPLIEEIKKYKAWIIIPFSYLATRIIIFTTYWQASVKRGLGWDNFYNYAEPAHKVLAAQWHEICDWHPPLYYFFTSCLLYIVSNQWIIYSFQIIIGFICVILAYKISNLFFSKKISIAVSFLVAIEPFYAWHNFMLSSENLEAPFLLLAIYFLFKYFKVNNSKDFFISAIFFGLSALTRPNHLFLTIFLSLIILIISIFQKYLKYDFIRINKKKLLKNIIIFNLIFFFVIAPWIIRNKFVYNRYMFAGIMETNIYHYNLPFLMSAVENISYNDAVGKVKEQAVEDLGPNVGDKGDCTIFTNDELNQQFDYFKEKSNTYIKNNIFTYIEMHLIKTAPFYLQPGYFSMIRNYTGVAQKPDITGLLFRGNFSAIINYFLSNMNYSIIIYFLGVAFWGLCSLGLLIAVFYSFFRDRERFLFFLLSLMITFYIALMTSPFVSARYRLAVICLFFVPIVYLAVEFSKKFRNKIN